LTNYMVSRDNSSLMSWKILTLDSQLNFARSHLEWSQRSMHEWQSARAEIGKIEAR
jgi:hypothetical protein